MCLDGNYPPIRANDIAPVLLPKGYHLVDAYVSRLRRNGEIVSGQKHMLRDHVGNCKKISWLSKADDICVEMSAIQSHRAKSDERTFLRRSVVGEVTQLSSMNKARRAAVRP